MRKGYGLLAIMIALTMVVGAFAPSEIKLYNRSAGATVAMSDYDALISLRNHHPPVGYSFVGYDSKGRMELKVQVGSVKINPDSENWFDSIMDVFNNNPENRTYTITSSNPRIKFYTYGNRSAATQSLTFTLNAGWSMPVGIYVDARNKAGGSVITSTVEVTATAP